MKGEEEELIEEDEPEESIDSEEEPSDDEMSEDNLREEDDLYDDYGDDYGGVPPMEKHNDLLKNLTNFSPYLKETINGWLGVSWSEEENKYIPNPEIKPIMNIKGATWCVSYLKTYVRHNNIITDVSSQEYQNIIHDLIENIWLNVGTRAEEFGINSNGDILRVCNEMQHSAELVLMGAGDGKYNKFLGTVTTRHENASIGNQPQYNNQLPVQMEQPRKGTLQRIKKTFLGT